MPVYQDVLTWDVFELGFWDFVAPLPESVGYLLVFALLKRAD
jgi:hypothetical protein